MSATRSEPLRSRTLQHAVARRAAGRPVDAVDPCSPLESLRRAAAQLHAVLDELEPDGWSRPAHNEIGTVRDVVAHLVGVERIMLGWVTADDASHPSPTHHLSAARAAAADVVGIDPAALVAQWFDAATAVAMACEEADPAKPVLAHDLPTDVDGLLVLRAFELWAHLQDVCRATGRAVPPIDAPRLTLMSSRLMAALPIAAALHGLTSPTPQVRFVLTGPGGGCHDVVFAPAAGSSTVTVVVDANDVCRVAARRLAVDALDVAVDGDASLVAPVLRVLDAFARD